MADTGPTRNSQYVQHNVPALNKALKSQGKSAVINNTNISLLQQNIINIQLSYNLNQLTEKDL